MVHNIFGIAGGLAILGVPLGKVSKTRLLKQRSRAGKGYYTSLFKMEPEIARLVVLSMICATIYWNHFCDTF
jgi:hypothetical protein